MNQASRRQYETLQKRVQSQMAKVFVGSVYRVLRKQISSFTSDVRNHGLNYAVGAMDRHLMDAELAKVIQNIHVKAGLFAAKRVRAVTNNEARKSGAYMGTMQLKRTGQMGFNQRITSDIIEYFRLHLLEKAVLPISATTKVRIETVLNKAVAEGWGVDRILQELESQEFREMTRRRAETIVRTEVVRAANFAGMAAANDSEFEMTKEWIAVNDNRTRRTHKHGTGVDGEKRDLLKPYSNGLQFPGDPNGPPEETINCRCSQAYRAKRDAQGRLIPKKRGVVVSLTSRLTEIFRRVAAFLNL